MKQRQGLVADAWSRWSRRSDWLRETVARRMKLEGVASLAVPNLAWGNKEALEGGEVWNCARRKRECPKVWIAKSRTDFLSRRGCHCIWKSNVLRLCFDAPPPTPGKIQCVDCEIVWVCDNAFYGIGDYLKASREPQSTLFPRIIGSGLESSYQVWPSNNDGLHFSIRICIYKYC